MIHIYIYIYIWISQADWAGLDKPLKGENLEYKVSSTKHTWTFSLSLSLSLCISLLWVLAKCVSPRYNHHSWLGIKTSYSIYLLLLSIIIASSGKISSGITIIVYLPNLASKTSYMCVLTKCVSPRYNCHGWLGFRKQVCIHHCCVLWQNVFHPDITVMVDWVLENNYVSIIVVHFGKMFHPDITITVGCWTAEQRRIEQWCCPGDSSQLQSW